MTDNPVVRVDRGGQFWDYAVDAGFLAWSIYDVYEDPGNWKNWAALGVDLAFAVFLFVPSGAGKVIKVGNKVDDAKDVANAINKIDKVRDAEKVRVIGRNMNMVREIGELIGKSVYEPWKAFDVAATGIKNAHNIVSFAHNFNWICRKLRHGYTIIDVGLPTDIITKGAWYGMEKVVVGIWKTRNFWKLAVQFLG